MSAGSAGVMGWPVAHSRSPVIHRFWLQALGLDGDYGRFPVRPEHLGEALRALPALGLQGVNLTVPHKVSALAHVHHLDPLARRVGAINTVVVNGSTLAGHNTDVAGVAEPLAAAGVAGAPVLVVGAGGAARAAAVALAGMGAATITIMNRSQTNARAMLAELGLEGAVLPLGAQLPVPPRVVVNASVLGMAGQPPLPLGLAALPPGATVFDMVYAPLETPLLHAARARGLPTIDGLQMLVAQAAAAFTLFFGAAPPRHLDPELRAVLAA